MDLYSMNFDKIMDFGLTHPMIQRTLEPLDHHLQPNRLLVVCGPRRVGKTTLLQNYLNQTYLKNKLATGDDLPTQRLLSSQDVNRILEYLEGYELFAIDEAQYVPGIGIALKIIVDHIPGIHAIATGPSSFELTGQIGEPLTGRKRALTLYPFSQSELLSRYNRFELHQRLDELLVFGTYPEVELAGSRKGKIEIVSEIAGSYLLRDILAFEWVRSSRKLWDPLRLIAFQIGNEVSMNELSTHTWLDVKTVQYYLGLLEKAYVLIRLGGFSRNLRKEISQKAKYYFLDNGIRNAIIAQFNRLNLRNDTGASWENDILIERPKWLSYSSIELSVPHPSADDQCWGKPIQ
jgi:predicted AAA+ superfamily ATPase